MCLCRLYCVHTWISHVMDLIKDDPRHFPHDLRASVQHAPQDLGENKFIIIRTTFQHYAPQTTLQ